MLKFSVTSRQAITSFTLSVCLSAYLSLCLSAYLSVCLSVFLSLALLRQGLEGLGFRVSVSRSLSLVLVLWHRCSQSTEILREWTLHCDKPVSVHYAMSSVCLGVIGSRLASNHSKFLVAESATTASSEHNRTKAEPGRVVLGSHHQASKSISTMEHSSCCQTGLYSQ